MQRKLSEALHTAEHMRVKRYGSVHCSAADKDREQRIKCTLAELQAQKAKNGVLPAKVSTADSEQVEGSAAFKTAVRRVTLQQMTRHRQTSRKGQGSRQSRLLTVSRLLRVLQASWARMTVLQGPKVPFPVAQTIEPANFRL